MRKYNIAKGLFKRRFNAASWVLLEAYAAEMKVKWSNYKHAWNYASDWSLYKRYLITLTFNSLIVTYFILIGSFVIILLLFHCDKTFLIKLLGVILLTAYIIKEIKQFQERLKYAYVCYKYLK